MKTQQLPFIALLLLLSSSCSSDKNADHQAGHDHSAMSTAKAGPVAELEKQVMDLHDSIMPAMSDLMRLQKAVTQKTATATGTAKEEGLAISSKLRQADGLMMDWMHHYNGDTLTKLSEADALTYLKAEQEKVSQVRDQMKSSMTQANAYAQKP